MRADILPACGKHLHDSIISFSEEVWAHKTSLTPPLLIEVPVQSQNIDRPYICVLGVIYMCVRGHIYVLGVIYMCVRGHIYMC
jgi:hypothetical protein